MADRISSNEYSDLDELSGEAVDLVEITGVVKWFDVAKGFGFIVPDNGLQDVLLHVTCLRRDGYQTILEGTRIVALIQRRERGYQAFKILSMDQSTAVHPSQLPPVRTHASTVLFPNARAMETRAQKYTYGTRGTPTTDALCEAIDALEGSAGTILVPSGLAAVTIPFLGFVAAGDHAP